MFWLRKSSSLIKQPYLEACQMSHTREAVADPEGVSGFARTPLPTPCFLISDEDEIIWSQ